jgi:hypothetical protein
MGRPPPPHVHRKETVDGSSPAAGSPKKVRTAGFPSRINLQILQPDAGVERARRRLDLGSVGESGFGFERVDREVVDGLDVACVDAAESECSESAADPAADH